MSALTALGAGASAAQAHGGDVADPIGGLCVGHVLTQPLTAFGDMSSYLLAPHADFESTLAGFGVTGGAAIQAGNEPYFVSKATDTHSLKLPAGATVTTPALCVTADYPSMRLFARSDGPDGKLGVQMVYKDFLGRTVVQGAGDIDAKSASGTWALTKSLPTYAGKLGVSLSIRLTAKDNSSWSVDDVLVDPTSRG